MCWKCEWEWDDVLGMSGNWNGKGNDFTGMVGMGTINKSQIRPPLDGTIGCCFQSRGNRRQWERGRPYHSVHLQNVPTMTSSATRDLPSSGTTWNLRNLVSRWRYSLLPSSFSSSLFSVIQRCRPFNRMCAVAPSGECLRGRSPPDRMLAQSRRRLLTHFNTQTTTRCRVYKKGKLYYEIRLIILYILMQLQCLTQQIKYNSPRTKTLK